MDTGIRHKSRWPRYSLAVHSPIPKATMTAPSETIERTRWSIVTVAVLAGILGGMQIGKVAPAIPVIRADLGLDLIGAGWVASLFTASGAVLGALIGASADRLGPRRASLASLACLGLGSLWGAFAVTPGELMLGRGLESFGFIGIAVSAPRLIVGAIHPADRDLVFGIWATWVPAGMAIAISLAPLLMPAIGWRGVWFMNAGLAAAMIVLLTLTTRPSRKGGQGTSAAIGLADGLIRVLKVRGAWLMAATFCCYSLQFLAVMAWLPSYLIEAMGLSPTAASLWTAVVVLANVIGNVGAGALLARGYGRGALLGISFAGMAVCATGIFFDWLPVEGRIAAAFLFSAVGGMIPGCLMAGAAVHAPTPVLIGVVNGLIMQGSNIGSLSGPPLLAFFVSVLGGWHAAGWYLALPCALGIAVSLLLTRAETQKGPAGP